MLKDNLQHMIQTKEVMPSLFLFLGTGNPQTSLHSPTFNFDEVVLETGVNAYLSLLESFQSKP